jgi:hypothetical protein
MWLTKFYVVVSDIFIIIIALPLLHVSRLVL